MAYGGPRSLDEVEPYYTDIRGGRHPSPDALEHLVDRYKTIGGYSPLPEITLRQARALQAVLDREEPERFRAYTGMKHWNPFIAEAVERIKKDGVELVVGLVLAPHYSRMSIGGYEERILRARESHRASFEVRMINSWYQEPTFIEFVAKNLTSTLESWDPSDGATRIFFTAHSLPARILDQGDPYRNQLLDSSRLIAEATAIQDWEFAFQSASATGEPWLGPDVLERLESFAQVGGGRAVVAPIGFVADHLEVLYDIDVECAERARELGLELRRIPSPNDEPGFINSLANIVRSAAETAPVADETRSAYAGLDPTLRSSK